MKLLQHNHGCMFSQLNLNFSKITVPHHSLSKYQLASVEVPAWGTSLSSLNGTAQAAGGLKVQNKFLAKFVVSVGF